MKRVKKRPDLMSKSEYSKTKKINRVAIDQMIEDGELSVEEISGKYYIKVV